MNIKDILDEQRIIEDLASVDKTGILKELAGVVASQKNDINVDLLLEKLVERESLSSTGIGDGIAIPHCKYENIDGIIMAFGRSLNGLDFDSIDKKPAHIFFLLVAPNTQKAAGEHLQTLAKITRFLKSDEFKGDLMAAMTREEIYKLITEEDEKYHKTI
jgi:PTS system nitrogen regulatory IIA component